ncbi:DUF2318 domain-containing protein [Desulfonatronum thioautotrophicum]|uniref:DUF2318 domain-containing protein n=1 Tax=Desulfonatronum thioautotrophicum TaxID=617001 RepID=UPI00069C17ED|nr:DUF2318 domain-containing protein [Desulfonatronum thioautotrophicum]
MTTQKDQNRSKTLSNQTSSASRRAAKKAAVLGSPTDQSSGTGSRKVVLAICSMLLVAVFSIILLFTHSETKDKAVEATPVTPENGELVHTAAMFTDGQARYFVLRAEDGLAIRYFALRTSEGVIRTAFDACDACWQANLGYVQDGDVMICRYCNMRFPSRSIGELRGGCNPSPLPSVVRDGNLVIRASDVLEGRRYFDFGPEGARG